MKYVIFTYEGTGYPIAKRLIEEKQDVLVACVDDFAKILTKFEKRVNSVENTEDKKFRKLLYKNIVPSMDADEVLNKLMNIPDPENYFLLFESNTLFYYSEKLMNKGFHGHFPTEEDRIFEVDRNSAKEFVKKYYPKIKIAEKKKFTKISTAINFLKDSNLVWVLKSQSDEIATFVPHTDNPFIADKLIEETLHLYQHDYESSGFILERKINNILEVTPEKIYYDGVPINLSINIENKFIGSGNISFQVGCAGDLVFPIDMKSRIHDIAFPPIVDQLAKEHKGLFLWDASLLIDSKTGDLYFGEFCPNRLWYNSSFTYFEQVSSVHHFFESVVQKKNPFKIGRLGVSASFFNLMQDPKTQQILADAAIHVTPEAEKHMWGYDIYKKTKKDTYRTVGWDFHLAPMTASGKTVYEAVKKLYEYMEQFSLISVYYRPKFDWLSTDYPTSILNRLQYCVDKKLFELPFKIK